MRRAAVDHLTEKLDPRQAFPSGRRRRGIRGNYFASDLNFLLGHWRASEVRRGQRILCLPKTRKPRFRRWQVHLAFALGTLTASNDEPQAAKAGSRTMWVESKTSKFDAPVANDGDAKDK
jgi:hypothetical protein